MLSGVLQKIYPLVGAEKKSSEIAVGAHGARYYSANVYYISMIKHPNFPQTLKNLAQDFITSHAFVRETQGYIYKLKNTPAAKQSDIDNVKKILNYHIKITGDLFKNLKNKYMSWFDKNIPVEDRKERPFMNCEFFATDAIRLTEINAWFKTYDFDYTKGELIYIKPPAKS